MTPKRAKPVPPEGWEDVPQRWLQALVLLQRHFDKRGLIPRGKVAAELLGMMGRVDSYLSLYTSLRRHDLMKAGCGGLTERGERFAAFAASRPDLVPPVDRLESRAQPTMAHPEIRKMRADLGVGERRCCRCKRNFFPETKYMFRCNPCKGDELHRTDQGGYGIGVLSGRAG